MAARPSQPAARPQLRAAEKASARPAGSRSQAAPGTVTATAAAAAAAVRRSSGSSASGAAGAGPKEKSPGGGKKEEPRGPRLSATRALQRSDLHRTPAAGAPRSSVGFSPPSRAGPSPAAGAPTATAAPVSELVIEGVGKQMQDLARRIEALELENGALKQRLSCLEEASPRVQPLTCRIETARKFALLQKDQAAMAEVVRKMPAPLLQVLNYDPNFEEACASAFKKADVTGSGEVGIQELVRALTELSEAQELPFSLRIDDVGPFSALYDHQKGVKVESWNFPDRARYILLLSYLHYMKDSKEPLAMEAPDQP